MFKKLLVFTPVLFSVLFFSINLLYLWHTSHDYVAPSFEDAVITCKDVSNDHWADYERTYQDKCIDKFMGEESFLTTTSELFWAFGLLLSIVGIAFIVPLSIYLLMSWRTRRYGYY
jgi:hypothetical protein